MESTECYYSEEMEVPCGVYKGNIVVDGRTYPVDEVSIKHYTFEVDLYIKEGNHNISNLYFEFSNFGFLLLL